MKIKLFKSVLCSFILMIGFAFNAEAGCTAFEQCTATTTITCSGESTCSSGDGWIKCDNVTFDTSGCPGVPTIE